MAYSTSRPTPSPASPSYPCAAEGSSGGLSLPYQLVLAAAFLVSVPVFFQAPLVRYAPWVSLVLTLGWLGISLHLISDRSSRIWGELLYGFTLTWLTGSLYWGWLRSEPYWHLPVEALALPLAMWAIHRGKASVGDLFYLGSLLGTAVTDGYIWLLDLFPEWRAVMASPNTLDGSVFFEIAVKLLTPWGIGGAVTLAFVLVVLGGWAVQSPRLEWRIWGSALLSTLLVDGLFGWSILQLSA